jgi:D-alanine-D-alanine ligase
VGIIRVGVLRGGPSTEHEISLKTGENVLRGLSLLRDKYSPQDIVLTKKNDWIFNRQFSRPDKIFGSLNVVFNALHGRFGEDGKIQQIFHSFKIPYTGSGILASALGMNKLHSRNLFKMAGLEIPETMVVDIYLESPEEISRKVFKTFAPPWVVKPIDGGSSLGVFIAHTFNELLEAIERQSGPKVLVEEFIRGKEVVSGVLEDFRGEEHYVLPLVEIIRYGEETREVCPGKFDRQTKEKILKAAKLAHRVLGCRHYSRQDFIISERPRDKGKIYILETDTLPRLSKNALIPRALEAVGASYPQFLDHLITLALNS